MVDLEILKEHGCSADHWKTLFDGMEFGAVKASPPSDDKKGSKNPNKPKPQSEDEIARNVLIERLRRRTEEGREWCIMNHRTIHALDQLWDAPLRTISPTLLASLSDKVKTKAEAEKVLKGFGFDITKILVTDSDPKTGEPVTRIDIPTFIQAVIPMVRSYSELRKAKIVNDRNRSPLIPFYPAINTPENRARCAAITSRAEVMNQQYNIINTLDQGVLQMLLYNQGVIFTAEEWHSEEQLRYKKSKPKEGEESKKEGKKETETFKVREGIRHYTTHPSRVYYDLSYPIKSFNTDTGCRYAGYWRVMKYRELKNHGGFYNLGRVSIGDINWWNSDAASVYWQTLYSCVITSPVASGSTSSDREAAIASNRYYADAMDDSYVTVTEHREIVNPKRDGLGSYPHDIWARFVLAGDGTIIYAAPMGYDPVIVFRDNGDDRRPNDASQALRLAGFQDQIANLMMQYLYAVKQNLTNITVIDKNIFQDEGDKRILDRLINLGERLWRGINIFPADLRKLKVAQSGIPEAFYSHRFPHLDTNSIVQAIKLTIEIAERVLGFSSQEVGQAATHEQTREEIRVIQGTTSNTIAYIGIPVDQAMQAIGRQIYEGWMNYGDDDFTASIPLEVGMTIEKLRELGFDVKSDDGKKANVRVPKSAIELITFATIPQNNQIVTNFEAAQALSTWLRDMMNNPITGPAIGPEQAIEVANHIAKLANLRIEAPLKNTGMAPNTAEEKMKEAQQIVEQVTAAVQQQVKEGMLPLMTQIQEVKKDVDALYQQIGFQQPQPVMPPNVDPNTIPSVGPEAGQRPPVLPEPLRVPGRAPITQIEGVIL